MGTLGRRRDRGRHGHSRSHAARPTATRGGREAAAATFPSGRTCRVVVRTSLDSTVPRPSRHSTSAADSSPPWPRAPYARAMADLDDLARRARRRRDRHDGRHAPGPAPPPRARLRGASDDPRRDRAARRPRARPRGPARRRPARSTSSWADGPGATVLLRADLDALPVQESERVDVTSDVDGLMHACGHDAHTAAMLGVACGARHGARPSSRVATCSSSSPPRSPSAAAGAWSRAACSTGSTRPRSSAAT